MAKQRTAAELQKQLDSLQATIASNAAKGLEKTESQAAAQERITKELKKQITYQNEALHTSKEMDETLGSIQSAWGKTNKLYDNANHQLTGVNKKTNALLSITAKMDQSQKAVKLGIEGAAAGYKKVNAEVFKNIAALADGEKIQGDIAGSLEEQIVSHKEIIKSVHGQDKLAKGIRATLREEVQEMEKLATAAKKAEKDISAIQREGEKFASTMVGGALDKTMKAFGSKKGVGGLVKQVAGDRGAGGMLGNVMGGVAKFLGPIGLAVGGIMAAAEFFNSGGAAKMAMRLATLTGEDPMKASDSAFKKSQQYRDLIVEQRIGLPVKLRQQAETDFQEYSISVAEDASKYKESLISDEIDYRMSLESDAISFRQQQASAELDAQLSQQKTLFTSGMGYAKQAIGISERALQAIGSSTQAGLDTVKEYGYTLGIALKDQISLGAAAQGLAVRLGTSATEVFKMADTFRLMNKTSAKTGANLVAGLEDLAKSNDMSPAQLYKEMADAQADILKYSSYTTEEYARQAIQLGNMNTSMASMMKASDSMVLNYKDSIKAEMSLSAMLGKNVNFAEVRAKLMSGDQAGGAAALKTALGGQDINAMNPFAKQALSQATGMGIQELMQLTQSKGGDAKGSLEEKNALKTGKAIAQGALSQDIANAAAKLALDQKNRAEMLKFEQAKRLSMLFVEQKFRLNAIAREFQYREDRETLSAQQAIENAQVSMLKEVSAEQIMSLTNAYSDSFGPGKADASKVAAYQAKISQDMNVLQQAMIQGRISDSEMVQIQGEIFKAALKGEQVNMSKFTGVQTYQNEQTTLAVATNKRNVEIVAALENLERIETERDKDGNLKNTGYQMQAARDTLFKLAPNTLKDFKNSKSFKGMGGKAYIESQRNQRLGGGTAAVVNKEIKKAVVDIKRTPNSTTETSKDGSIKTPIGTTQLSDSQAQVKLQVQMVKLLGVSAQFLGQIDANTLNGKTATIDGKPLAKKLLDQANRTYGVAGVS